MGAGARPLERRGKRTTFRVRADQRKVGVGEDIPPSDDSDSAQCGLLIVIELDHDVAHGTCFAYIGIDFGIAGKSWSFKRDHWRWHVSV